MPVGPKTTMVLERYSDTADGIGGLTRTWAPKRNIIGVFQVIRGEESPRGNKPSVIVTHSFHCDFPIGITITEKDRLKLSTRIFNIVLIDDIGNQNRFLRVSLVEAI